MKHGNRLLVVGLGVIALAVALALIAPWEQDSVAADGIIYVDADAGGANDGTNWEDAFTTLQPALEAAVSGDQIWVAEGTYKPTAQHGGTGDRYRSFQMVNGVAIYGGFDPTAGDETWEERDWVNNMTILSGDIGVVEDRSDNSYHVFYHPDGTDLDGTAVLDGFTITGGNADGDWPHYDGGGMYNNGSSPTLSNCTFSGNRAYDTEFGEWGFGGGMVNYRSSPALTNCTFSGNSALSRGGGIYNSVGFATLTDCTFSGNSAMEGGAMFNAGGSPTLTNCTFEDNSAGGFGGGIHNQGSSPTLTNCTFEGNSAGGFGGGIFNEGNSPMLTNCTFSSNSADSGGGGMYNTNGTSPTLSDCTFSSNSADEGGGIYNRSSSPVLTNCTLAGNSAEYHGGGMFNYNSSSPVLTNCILWGNSPGQITNDSSTAVVTYSDIQGGHPGEGNIDLPPFFVDPDNADFHLRACSPCVDAGDNEAPALPLYDFEGDDRILDGDDDGTPTVDMGVDEVVDGLPCSQVYLPLVLRGY